MFDPTDPTTRGLNAEERAQALCCAIPLGISMDAAETRYHTFVATLEAAERDAVERASVEFAARVQALENALRMTYDALDWAREGIHYGQRSPVNRAMDAAKVVLDSAPEQDLIRNVLKNKLIEAACAVARLNVDRPDSIRPQTNGAQDALHALENAWAAVTGEKVEYKEEEESL